MTWNHYQLKPLSAHELPDIMAIEREVKNIPWSATTMRDSILAAHNRVWGVFLEHTNTLIGYAILSVVIDEAELLSMAIHPNYHRQGLGESLLNFILSKAQEEGVESVYLEVRANNQPALKLYQKLCFDQQSIRRAYYPSSDPNQPGIDAVVMMRPLDAA